MLRLGVNIDHVATIRNARGGDFPDPVRAAHVAEAAGARLVGDAVRDAWRVRGAAATGWPVIAWMGRLKPDPLRRLHLPLGRERGRDPALHRTGMPAMSAAQRAQAEELRAVLDAVPAGIWIAHDPEAREIAGNARSHEMLRVPQGVNQSLGAVDAPRGVRFLDGEGREVAVRDLPVQRAARGEAVAAQEYRLAFEGGGYLDILGNATPLRDAAGQPTGAVAAFVERQIYRELAVSFKLLMEAIYAGRNMAGALASFAATVRDYSHLPGVKR